MSEPVTLKAKPLMSPLLLPLELLDDYRRGAQLWEACTAEERRAQVNVSKEIEEARTKGAS